MTRGDKREVRARYEHKGEFEHELLNRRATWLLTSQTLLFAAYGVSLSENAEESQADLFREVIPELGIALSIVIWIGVIAGLLAKVRSLLDFRGTDPSFREEPLGIRTWITVLGYVPDFSIPLLFIWTWWQLAKC